jgi:hypothetical protein
MTQRFKLPPGGDVPPDVAARRLGITLEAFRAALPVLLGRKFPAPDETTGNFMLEAIDRWREARHPQLFPSDRLILRPGALDAGDVIGPRVERIRQGGRREN